MRNGFDPTTPGASAQQAKLDPAHFVKKADIEPTLKVETTNQNYFSVILVTKLQSQFGPFYLIIQNTFQLLNETVSESMAIVDDVRDIHHAQMSSLDAKVDENEELGYDFILDGN